MNKLSILNTIAITGIVISYFLDASLLTKEFDLVNAELDKHELALAAKIPAKIKFYTVPGYACDTSEIPGHCTNMWSLTQAAYDKDFFKEEL